MIKPAYVKHIGASGIEGDRKIRLAIRGRDPEVSDRKECPEYVPPLDVVEERRKAARAKELEDVFA